MMPATHRRAGQLRVDLRAVDGERRGEREGQHGGHGDARRDAEAADGRPQEHGGQRPVDERQDDLGADPAADGHRCGEQHRQAGIVGRDLAALRRRLGLDGAGRGRRSRASGPPSSSARSRLRSSARLMAVSRYCGSSAAVRDVSRRGPAGSGDARKAARATASERREPVDRARPPTAAVGAALACVIGGHATSSRGDLAFAVRGAKHAAVRRALVMLAAASLVVSRRVRRRRRQRRP